MPRNAPSSKKSALPSVFLGADHAGFVLKEAVKKRLTKLGYAVTDCGAMKLQKDDDYPDYAAAVARAVAKTKGSKGILVCGSSEGVCVAANKIKHIRAVSVFDVDQAKKSRQHVDANVLCLSGWYLWQHQAFDITEVWLTTKFSGEARHKRRIKKIGAMEW